MKTSLNKVTLLAVDCVNSGAAITALRRSMEQCDFACVKLLTDIPLNLSDINVVNIPSIKSKEQYSRFMIKELYKHFDTEFVLVIQHDGYVLDGSCWDDEFYKYDYIGAPWLYTDGKNVGNGGFSLRSKKLQDILGNDDFIFASDPEDQAIGRLYCDYLIKKYNIKYPPEELADKFSFELKVPASKTFGFHGKFHMPYKPIVVIKRMAAMGDVIRTEPVLRYFNDNGYIVVLDTLVGFQMLFTNHYFKVYKLDEIPDRLLKNARFINLDMSYENQPQKPHLISYFEFAGIEEKDYKPYLTNPKLYLGFEINNTNKIFKKYAVIHIEDRAQASRNIRGIDWAKVAKFLNKMGYNVIQLGKNLVEIEGVLNMNTVNENILSYVVASADLFIGIDSGISHIASGFEVPSIIFFGNVDPDIIHIDNKNKYYITNHRKENPICEKPYCWHSVVGCVGTPCYIDNLNPPCSMFDTSKLINTIELLNAIQKI